MKEIKVLLVLFVVTLVLGFSGVKADHFVAYIQNERIPRFGGSWSTSTFYVGAENGFEDQMLYNINADSGINVRVAMSSTPTDAYGGWNKLPTSGQLLMLNRNNIINSIGGYYHLEFRTNFSSFVDRYVHYADWYFHQ